MLGRSWSSPGLSHARCPYTLSPSSRPSVKSIQWIAKSTARMITAADPWNEGRYGHDA